MVDIQMEIGMKRKSRPQTPLSGSNENYSGMHNLEVPGSSPGPATKEKTLLDRVFSLFERIRILSLLRRVQRGGVAQLVRAWDS